MKRGITPGGGRRQSIFKSSFTLNRFKSRKRMEKSKLRIENKLDRSMILNPDPKTGWKTKHDISEELIIIESPRKNISAKCSNVRDVRVKKHFMTKQKAFSVVPPGFKNSVSRDYKLKINSRQGFTLKKVVNKIKSDLKVFRKSLAPSKPRRFTPLKRFFSRGPSPTSKRQGLLTEGGEDSKRTSKSPTFKFSSFKASTPKLQSSILIDYSNICKNSSFKHLLKKKNKMGAFNSRRV